MSALEKLRWMLLDALLVAIALALAYVQRFLPVHLGLEMDRDAGLYLRQALLVAPVLISLRILLFFLFDMYRGILRFAGVHELRQVIVAVSTGTVALIGWDLLIRYLGQGVTLCDGVLAWVPVSVIAVDWMGCVILVGGVRMATRLWELTRSGRGGALHNVLIVGASDVGEQVARNFIRNPQMGYRPVGFVDDAAALRGRQIHGLPVYGGVADLPRLIERLGVQEVLVALHKPSLPFLNRLVEICETAHVGFKIVPSVSDLMQERISINQVRPVEIEDLLGREPVDLALSATANYLRDEIVLVTGAGGSIGSELCRQILRSGPRRLILLGHGENSLYEIAMELGYDQNHERLALEIADIQDRDRLGRIYEHYKPTVVFHAAAHKHVPLMELHPQEAIKNNVIGTYNVASLALAAGVKRFTLISTDKAVRPTSIMGASKRVAEMVVSALSRESKTTAFLSVRFGNVLGSRGSVVPLFRKQIAAGGPVTVMHPEIERYFMTIPEASSLVLQAGAMGKNGQLFILDMGRPIKITELARRMITLSGYEPNVDIQIEFVGLRPGEKLMEELLTDDENLEPTGHAKIFATRVSVPRIEEVEAWLDTFRNLIRDASPEAIVEAVRAIVPEYTPMRLHPVANPAHEDARPKP